MTQVVPLDARAEFARGLAAQHAGDSGGAMTAYRQAITADPSLAAAHFNLGLLLRDRGELAAAVDAFAAATNLRPKAADGWLHLGLAQELGGLLDHAAESYRRSIELDPGAAAAHFNLGNVERKRDRRTAALAAFQRARDLAPEAPEVLLNLGNLLREIGEPGQAIEVLEACRTRRPDHSEATWNLSLASLAAGRLEEGWRHYEQRWARIGRAPERIHSSPRWRGESLAGKRILVWREQGIGDELLFATCLPDLLDTGAEVTAALDPRIAGLVRRAFPSVTVIDEASAPAWPADVHAPLGDLPRFLRRTRRAFEPRWSYLVPDRTAIAAAIDRLPAGPDLRVGICWRSGLRDVDRRRYYASLDAWAPILTVPGVRFVNLQYDECEAELVAFERSHGVAIHRAAGLSLRDDLEGVAGLIWHLDLVITAPTAVSSLAGALGIETWQLDSGNDWTLFGEERSPWLPAIRAFRRPPDADDWQYPIDAIRDALLERRRVLMTLKGRERS